MEELERIYISDFVLDKLRCSICQEYLSHTPIQILPDNSSICGRCQAITGDGPIYRQLTLERALRTITFPCRYKKYGCKERVPFDHDGEHEITCNYRCFPCPLSTTDACSWVGSIFEFHNHFSKKHPELIKPKMEFVLDVEKDSRGIQMALLEDVVFMLRHDYRAITKSLIYDVRYLMFNIQEATYKLRLTNDLDPDYSNTVKGTKIRLYNNDFHTMQEPKEVTMTNFLATLDYPKRICVTLDVTVLHEHSVANKKTLDILKCNGCKEYLLPPLFNCHIGTICSDCCERFKDHTPLNDKDLTDKIFRTNYPCRWKKCKFVGKIADIRTHEPTCTFRIYKCLNGDCEVTFTKNGAIEHLRGHGYKYFTGTFSYKMQFSNFCEFDKFFTMKYYEIFQLRQRTFLEMGKYRHELSVTATDFTGLNILKTPVEVEFIHCEKKVVVLQSFNSISNIFNLEDFPDCFTQDDQIKVKVKF